MFHGHLGCFQKLPLGGRPNTKSGDHGALNAHNRWFILFYHVWGSAWIEIHWNRIWLMARSHMASHYNWGSVTTVNVFGNVLGRPLDTLFWALTISWSRLLDRVRQVALFSLMRLKVRDHCVLRALISQKGRDRPNSLRARKWRPKDPKSLMRRKSLHGFLHGNPWRMFHGMSEFVSTYFTDYMACYAMLWFFFDEDVNFHEVKPIQPIKLFFKKNLNSIVRSYDK